MHARIEENMERLSPKPAELHDLRKLILKLRWIGLDREAERLMQLVTLASPTFGPLLGPLDTD